MQNDLQAVAAMALKGPSARTEVSQKAPVDVSGFWECCLRGFVPGFPSLSAPD